jgi:DNA-binding response OmpR family regulator
LQSGYNMEHQDSATILIVEDEQDTIDLLSILLQRQGYRINAACTGTEGLDACQNPHTALVLLDVMLPDMSGFDVCLKIKKSRPDLPVIILTVRNKPFDVVTGLDSGADDYITKPFSNSVLLARVRAALRARPEKAIYTQPQLRQPIIAANQANPPSELEQKQAESPDQLRQASEVLPVISHELRSPVAAIKGFITTLISNHRYWNASECEAFLENVNESVDQLSRIVENVLEMGRLEKEIQLYRRPTRLASLVQRVLQDFSFHPTRCEFIHNVPVDLPMIAIDPLRIERVLRNLIENSVKFSPQGGRIRVFARLEERIEIGVEDQGIGISPEHLPHIFERFYQAGQPETRKEGIGLGLYIARELIHAHGGQMWATSQLGEGTTLYFALPLDGSVPAPKNNLAAIGHTTTTPNNLPGRGYPKGERPTILIVEDDQLMLQLLDKSLTAQGFKIVSTSFGNEAIGLVQIEKPDLVLLDLILPDVDGLIVCEQVRQFSNVPIIIITRRKTEPCKLRALALGADDYLIKPFSNQELLARLRAVLRRAQAFPKKETPKRLKFGDLEIDRVRCEVRTPHGVVRLTPTEHSLLCHLASNAGHVLTHQQLLTKVWGYECDQQTQYLWVNISRLRKKIEPDPDQPYYILTEPGVGYYFSLPNQV